ncbi:hypothetical protein OAA90_02645 [Salibacteraceae bacterium]|jgi:hypothetical protein|nr:hypothetical protein [Crocinitomicaceae bacterium]MDB9725261.1 hypothetical protein [Salibacteraceae bacterium]MDC1204629.1 hypothetical protein [Salibacteraceae bacterium]|tara:strand:+ start:14865 stop:15821 length:957 start_codon:yes stop_codon:yes gene_type:complete
MLPRALKKNTPQSISIAILYALPFIVLILLQDIKIYDWTGKSNLSVYLNPINNYNWLNKLFGISLLLGTATYAQYVYYKYRLFAKGNQFVFILSVALLACGAYAGAVSPWALGAAFLIRLIDRCFEIQRSNNPNMIIVEASFTAGLLWMISSEFLWVFPTIILAYLYSGSLQIRGFFISVFGFVLPYYFLIGLNYLFDFPVIVDTSVHLPSYFAPNNLREFVLLGGCLLVLIIGFRYLFQAIIINKVIIKNHLVLLIGFTALSIVSASMSAAGFGDIIVGAFPAFGVLAGLYFLNASKVWLMEITFFVWYGSVLFFVI